MLSRTLARALSRQASSQQADLTSALIASTTSSDGASCSGRQHASAGCGPSLSSRHRISTSAAASAEPPATQPPAPSTASKLVPSWMRNWLFPDAKAPLDAKSPSNPTPPPAAAKDLSKEEKKEREQSIEQLHKAMTMDVDAFIAECREKRVAEPRVPRPKFPSLPVSHPDWQRHYDFRRIGYLRTVQVENIALKMTAEDKAAVKVAGDNALAAARGREALQPDILKDKPLLQKIAQQTNNSYIDLEVKDCISMYLEGRRRASRLHFYLADHNGGTNATPSRQEDLDKAEEDMKADEKREKLQRLRGLVEVHGCPVEPKLAWAGPKTQCGLTGLAYWECCGSKHRVQTDSLETFERPPTLKRHRGGPYVIKQRLDLRMLKPFRRVTAFQEKARFREDGRGGVK